MEADIPKADSGIGVLDTAVDCYVWKLARDPAEGHQDNANGCCAW